MINKTIILDHAVAERITSAIEQDHLFNHDDLEALRTALAEPVPPAGGEPEVLAWMYRREGGEILGQLVAVESENLKHIREGLVDELHRTFWPREDYIDWRPLVDRAHVTRLQAEVERQSSTYKHFSERYAEAIDSLRAEVERLKVRVADQQRVLSIASQCERELHTELTKARELAVLVHQGMNGLLALEEDADVLDYLGAKAADLLGIGQTPSSLNAFLSNQSAPADKARPELTVWYGTMPESNGKSNFTAILMRKGGSLLNNMTDGITLYRGEYPDRARYEADRARYLIGELSEEPDILAYDADKHSDYVKPADNGQGVPVASWTDGTGSLYRLCPVVGSLQVKVSAYGESEKWETVQMTPAHALTKLSPLHAEQPAPVAVVMPKLEMADVVRAHMEIPGCPVMTSNQCHTLAMKLNDRLNTKS